MWLDELIENYRLAKTEMATFMPYESVHWQRLNAGFEDRLSSIELWQNFRNNRLSHGLDDANFYAGLKEIPNLEEAIKKRSQVLRSHGENIHELARESPVGAPKTVKVNDIPVSLASLDFAYFASQLAAPILDKLSQPLLVVEIGGGFGGLARVLKRLFPKMSYVMLDLPEALAMSTYYLQQNFPEARLCLLRDFLEKQENWDPSQYDFSLLPGWRSGALKERSVEVFINTRSMMEMQKHVIATYFAEIQRSLKIGGIFYCANRYIKRIGQEDVCLADYPFDAYWEFLLSKPKWGQKHIHELIGKRTTTAASLPHAALQEVRELGKSAKAVL